ncbi:FAD binding domain-containing protein [Thermodesulfobacteriota bacterium]
MLLPKFDFHEPQTIDEACTLLDELGERTKLLAGGTDLIVSMKRKILAPEHLVSLSEVQDLRTLDTSGDHIRIGACLTAAELAESTDIRTSLNALNLGAGSLGSPLIRNRATIAGNLVTARPAADLPPPLMAFGAEVVLKSKAGERFVALKNFFKGPGETVAKPDEILTEIQVIKPPPHTGSAYIKLGTRQALEISLVNVAAFIALEKAEGGIKKARIVLGAVAPIPMRALSAEKILIGEAPGESLFEKAGEAAAADSQPIDDFRGSAEYRRAMVKTLTQRALDMACQQALQS